MYQIEGSWRDEIRLRDCTNNNIEVIWRAEPLDHDANMQFFFTADNCLLNYKCPEMVGVLPPTDARFRNDIRLMEEGKIEEADKEKLAIEIGQR